MYRELRVSRNAVRMTVYMLARSWSNRIESCYKLGHLDNDQLALFPYDHRNEEQELAAFLKAIEDGSVFLRPEHQPQDVYAGNVGYVASNGWRIVVYNDANEWDYIGSITTVDGRIFSDHELDQIPAVAEYQPSEEIAWSKYGIPGHCVFRCTECGTRIKKERGKTITSPFLCNACKTKR